MKRRTCQRFGQRSGLFQGALALFLALMLPPHRPSAAGGHGRTVHGLRSVRLDGSENVSGLSGSITNVSMRLTSVLQYAFGDDLDLLLVHPNGANNLEFMSDATAPRELHRERSPLLIVERPVCRIPAATQSRMARHTDLRLRSRRNLGCLQ